MVTRRRAGFPREEGVSPAQILVVLLIVAVVALVLTVALRRVI